MSDDQLLQAAKANDTARCQTLIDQGANASHCDNEGVTCLMAAAEHGNAALVNMLLQAGAPWMAQDKEGYTAGEYASGSGHKHVVEQLLDFAVRSELLLRAASQSALPSAPAANSGTPYLQQRLEFRDGVILDETGEAVMMGWERPLMVRHAAVMCRHGGDVLNVGFGLGIIDEEIQKHNPRSHTIVEAHPDIHARMLRDGWDDKPGVRVVFGRWQDVLADLGPFDAIFWDTYGEYWEDFDAFQQHLPRLLRRGRNSVYTYFNGFAPDNVFFHLVYGRLNEVVLARQGLHCTFTPVPIRADDAEWVGVANRYWHFGTYFLPTVTWKEDAAGQDAQHDDSADAQHDDSADAQHDDSADAQHDDSADAAQR